MEVFWLQVNEIISVSTVRKFTLYRGREIGHTDTSLSEIWCFLLIEIKGFLIDVNSNKLEFLCII